MLLNLMVSCFLFFFLLHATDILQTLHLCIVHVAGHQDGLCFLKVGIKHICFTAVRWCSKWLLMSFKCVFAGTCWHLRKLDWCEEVGEPLMDEVSVGRSSEPTGPKSVFMSVDTFSCLSLYSFSERMFFKSNKILMCVQSLLPRMLLCQS